MVAIFSSIFRPSARSCLRSSDSGIGGSSRKYSTQSGQSSRRNIDIETEANLRYTLDAIDLLVNDDVDVAIVKLRAAEPSVYKDFGLTLVAIYQAAMSMESKSLRIAVDLARACEQLSYQEWNKAGRFVAGSKTAYPAGTSYAVIYAMASLISGAAGILDCGCNMERTGAVLKALWKLRRASATLKAVWKTGAEMKKNSDSLMSHHDCLLSSQRDYDQTSEMSVKQPEMCCDSGAEAEEFVVLNMEGFNDRGFNESVEPVALTMLECRSTSSAPDCQADNPATPPDDKTGVSFKNPVDMFSHSGADWCYGALQLIFCIMPPAAQHILSTAGLSGNREQALELLWRSSTCSNVFAHLSALTLLAFYTGVASLSDILPSASDFDIAAQAVGYPETRCAALLADVQAHYPNSPLWRLLAGRTLASARRLPEAMSVLTAGPEPKMRSVAVLLCWETAMTAMCGRDWPGMRKAFERCASLNDWTRTFYYYCAAAAEVEMYRDAAETGASTASRHGRAAERLFRRALEHVGDRRLMRKLIPHEIFIARQVRCWQGRADELSLDLVDAIAISPAQEMIYVWNGSNKMLDSDLALSLHDVDFSRCTSHKVSPSAEDRAVRAVCAASILRRSGLPGLALDLLHADVLSQQSFLSKKKYVIPMAHFEKAVLAWDAASKEHDDVPFRRRQLVACRHWLLEAGRWKEPYLLDDQFGLRIHMAQNTVAWYQRKMGW